MSAVKGLETVTHRGPPTIGPDAIYRSQGKIPEAFLRGAGGPDDFISYVSSLVTGKAMGSQDRCKIVSARYKSFRNLLLLLST